MELSHLFLMFWAALMFWGLGQIWFGQIVVYPLFAKVGAADYVHCCRNRWLAGNGDVSKYRAITD